jgi:hypothetical protein
MGSSSLVSGSVFAVVLTMLVTSAAAASGVDTVNGGMPSRISMNVTVPKQTQGATFGEKVNAGLHAAGSVVSQGASLTIACGPAECAVSLPDGSGYRANLQDMTLAPLAKGQVGVPAAAGNAVPGAGIVSAAVSAVGTRGAGSGAAAASYAATGRQAMPAPLASRRRDAGNIDVTEPLADGDYVLTLVVEKATSGLKDTLKTQVRMAAPPRVRIDMVFSVEGGVLKARHDTAKNAIGNIR